MNKIQWFYLVIIVVSVVFYILGYSNHQSSYIFREYSCPSIDYNEIKNNIVLKCEYEIPELCLQKDLIIPYEKLEYKYDKEQKTLIVYGVDFISAVTGNSMLPYLQQDQIIFWKKFSGDWKELKINQLVLSNLNGKKISHLIKSIYPNRLKIYGINNGGNSEWVDVNNITHIEGKLSG